MKGIKINREKFQDQLDSFTIIYTDDGQGVDHERIAQKALKNSLITIEQVSSLSPQEKVNLIFLPHFSTKEVATDISGRGFGMDVVKDAVDRLGGTILLTTEIGCGLKVTIHVCHRFSKANKRAQAA